jgi:hypothetical protein
MAMLTEANKKLSEALAKALSTTPGTPGTFCPTQHKPFPGNYCWTRGHRCSQHHTNTSATCGAKATGHQDTMTASNTMGGSEKDKGWNTLCT